MNDFKEIYLKGLQGYNRPESNIKEITRPMKIEFFMILYR